MELTGRAARSVNTGRVVVRLRGWKGTLRMTTAPFTHTIAGWAFPGPEPSQRLGTHRGILPATWARRQTRQPYPILGLDLAISRCNFTRGQEIPKTTSRTLILERGCNGVQMGKRVEKKRNGKKKNGVIVSRAARAKPLVGIKQGTGKSVAMAFRAMHGGNHRTWFDATHPHHLPLPRAVGPYAVVRTTGILESTAQVQLFGATTMWDDQRSARIWSSTYALSSNALGTAMNAASNAISTKYSGMDNAGWAFADIVPAAVTVQVINPEAIQSSTGTVFVGRVDTLQKLSNRTITWQDYINQIISYNRPRLCAAAKLAMRGVTMDCVPYDMSELASFTGGAAQADGTFTWDNTLSNPKSTLEFGGFAPSYVYNPSAIKLQYVVVTEWRVRFDPTNPAQSSHMQFQVSSDQAWGASLQSMRAMGHGVRDIAAQIANFGTEAKETYQALRDAFGAVGSVSRLALAGA